MEEVRIDKWLWAARFFKTRSLAVQAVSGGHVTVNGSRAKSSRLVRVGDMLSIRRETLTWNIRIIALNEQRGPASLARSLYEESEESIARREQLVAERKAMFPQGRAPEHRPNKHERRKIRQFLQKE